MKNLNQTEKETLDYIVSTMYTATQTNVRIMECQSMSFLQYQHTVKINKGKREGLLAVKPPFLYAGRERYNDFAVYHPSLKHSYAIECKLRTTSTVSPNEFHREVQIRKDNVLEKMMCFFLDGQYSEVKKFNLESLTDKCKLVYDLNDLVLK